MERASDARLSTAGKRLHLGEERFRLLVETIKDYAIFMLDADGIVQSWNAGAEKIKGYKADEIIGQPFSRFYPPEAVVSGWPQQELREARRLGHFEDEGWRVRKDGTRFWANVIITALYDEQGEVTGFAKVTRDLSERRRQEEALRQSEERFRLLVESVRDYAIFMLDPAGYVQSWNTGAQAMKGYVAPEVLGRHFSIFHTADDLASGKPARLLAQALGEGRAHDEGWRVRKDGTVFWADVTITPVHDTEGRLRGFAKVTHDMSERRRLADLESSSRRMMEFLAMLAHELRNPLAPIRNAVSILQLEKELSSRVLASRDIIDRQLAHLTRLVDDLLDVGRVATGKISLKRERISLREVVFRSIEAARPLIDARRHTLELRIPDDPISMVGDGTRLAQVLQNLLVNAAKFTDEGGRIELDLRTADEMAVLTVRDTGRGIATEALERVFELFTQEECGRPPSESGLGIGLTLARTLVELHGGTIRAYSAGRGRGSEFTVRLPLSTALVESPAAGAAASAQLSTRRQRVLIVDDNRDSADTMASLLQVMGHDALPVYSGEQAVPAAGRFAPDLVLLDLNMPGTNGFDVMQHLRTRLSERPARVVAMTGYGQEGDRQRTMEAGFDAHLIKPISMEQLRRVMEPPSAA
ncbi:MAG: PAS domain-containing hybrid sensor histidine kinase/response regulator [Pseudomonadota bacterium]